ncbi:hypothetical protein [Holdemanella biformis]|jgi:hypothetical protein|uniref:hypothetical protein n=1 Tax=Holdemanella biformis TaxID=1735 RepID=UPI0022E8FE8A|nr:hypothetical protein [Holdemanella biformis]
MDLQTVFINCLYLLGVAIVVSVIVYTVLYTTRDIWYESTLRKHQREVTEYFREGCKQAYKELHRGDKNE